MDRSNNIARIFHNHREIGAVYHGGQLIWPSEYVPSLTVSWSFGGNYGITAIPAGGGYAVPTWTLTLKRQGTIVYQQTVTPTSVYIDDSSNFYYSYNSQSQQYRWGANGRGTNGYSSSTNRPSTAQWSSPARVCKLTASYRGTVTVTGGQSVQVGVSSEEITMTQSANTARYVSGSNSYDTFTMSLNNFYDSAHEAKACEQTATASASCRCGNYILWDSGSHAYFYQTIGNYGFVFSSTASWITVEGRSITAASRSVDEGPQRTATITARLDSSIYGTVAGYATATFYQKANSSTPTSSTCSSLSITSFKVNNQVVNKINSCNQTVVTVAVKATWRGPGARFTAYYDGDDTAYTLGTLHSDDTTIELSSALAVDGADSTTKTSFTVTNIHTTSEKTWTVGATYLDKTISVDINQVSDPVTTTTSVQNSVSISVTNSTLSASGGTLTLQYSASHTVTTIEKWSDGTQKSSNTGDPIDDTSRATVELIKTGTASGYDERFSRSGTTVTHTTMANNKGNDKVKVKITHPDDNTKTAETSEYTASNDKHFGTPNFTAGPILASANFVEFFVTCPITWDSGYNDPGLTTSDFSFALVGTPYNNLYRTYSLSSGNGLTVTSLAKHDRDANSNTTKVRATYSETGYNDVTKEIYLTENKNKKGGGGTVTTPGTKTTDPNRQAYNEYDYTGYELSVALSNYSSSSSPAHFEQATYANYISAQASRHKVRTMSPWVRNDTKVDTWDSGAQDDPETIPEYGWDEGSWVDDSPDTISFDSNQSWLTISGTDISVGSNDPNQGGSGSARNATITAKVLRKDNNQYITATTTFYQSKYCSISASVSSLVFGAQAGSATFTVSYYNTRFTVSFSSPVASIRPTTRQGSASGSGSVEYTVTWNTTSNALPTLGDITITPEESVLQTIEIGVQQEGLVQGLLSGYINAEWDGNFIRYDWLVRNTGNTEKKLYLTVYFCETQNASDNPDSAGTNQVSQSISGEKTVPAASGGNPGEASGSGSRYLSRTAGLTYWAKLTGTNGMVASSWKQIGEQA